MTREEAIKLAIRACEETWNEKTCKQIKEVLKQESKTGHWIEGVNGHFNCSECNTDFFTFRDIRVAFIYCPYCGAKMVDEQERSDKE